MFKFKKKNKDIFDLSEIFDYIELEIYKAICCDGKYDNLINIEAWLAKSKKAQQKEKFNQKMAILNSRINMLSSNEDYDDFYDTGDIFGQKVNGGFRTNNGNFISIPNLKVRPGESTFGNVFEEINKKH